MDLYLHSQDLGQAYSPLEAGLAPLPMTAIMLALSARSGRLAARIGSRAATQRRAAHCRSRFCRARPGHQWDQLPGLRATRSRGIRPRFRGLGRAAYRYRAELGIGRSRRDRLRGQQCRRPTRRPARGSGTARAVRPNRRGLPAPGRAGSLSRTAALIAAGLCTAGGLIAAITIANPPRPPRPEAGRPRNYLHCGLDATPLTTAASSPDTGSVPHLRAES